MRKTNADTVTHRSSTNPRAIGLVEALFDFAATNDTQLSLRKHERILLLQKHRSGWWVGENAQRKTGMFPGNYVRIIEEPLRTSQPFKNETIRRPSSDRGIQRSPSTASIVSNSSIEFKRPKEYKPITQSQIVEQKKKSKQEVFIDELGLDPTELTLSDTDEENLEENLDAFNDIDVLPLPMSKKSEFSEKDMECLKELKRDVKVLEMEKQKLSKKNNELTEELKICKKKIDLSKRQQANLQKQMNQMKEQKEQLEKEVLLLRTKLSSSGNEEIAILSEDNMRIKKEMEEMREALEKKLNQTTKELEELTEKNAQLQLQLDEQRKINEKFESDRSEFGKSSKEMQEHVARLEDQMAKQKELLHDQMTLLEQKEEEVKELNKKIDQYELLLRQHNVNQTQEMSKQIEKYEKSLKESKNENQKLQKKLKELEKVNQSLNFEISQQRQGMNKKAAEKEKKLKDEIEKYKKKVQEVEKKLKEKENEKFLLENKFKTKMEELNNQYNVLKETMLKQKEDLQKIIEENKQRHQQEMNKMEQRSEGLTNTIKSLVGVKKQISKFRKLQRDTKTTVKKQLEELATMMHQLHKSEMKKLIDALDAATKKYLKEMKQRRKLFNEIQNMKGNIRVYVRCRPLLPHEGVGGAVKITGNEIEVFDDVNKKCHKFHFEKVFDDKSTQEEVFEDIKALATSVLDGYNVCIFAYGQTGSGKTYTMEGPENDRGVNYRTLNELFVMINKRKADFDYTVKVAVMEIYNEQLFDLLSPKRKRLEIQMAKDVTIPGLTLVDVKSAEEVFKVLIKGYQTRSTFATNVNEHSSRSHCILSVYTEGVNRTTQVVWKGKLHLIDLAGSERIKKSLVVGDRLTEAQNINKSLSALGDVISSLAAKAQHVPFRNSELTKLLKDSLGGNSKTLTIVNINPCRENAVETVCSLGFGNRVKRVELGQITRNVSKKK